MFSDDSNVRIIQEESLVALSYFHQLCVEHSISYSVHAGTMLGAVREKGFISWDDDVDLAMTRSEYRKLEKLLNTIELDDYYSFDTYSYVSPRLCLRRPNRPLVWVTIFIYDFISENRIARLIKTKTIGCYYFLINGHEENAIKVVGNPLKAFVINCMRMIGRAINKETLLKKYRRFCEKAFIGKEEYIQRANDRYCYQGVGIVLPKSDMVEYAIIFFENAEVMISKAYDHILTTSYGSDYMIPKKDSTKSGKHQEIRNNLER